MVDKVREGGRVNHEGYVNVGQQLGMLGVRGMRSRVISVKDGSKYVVS